MQIDTNNIKKIKNKKEYLKPNLEMNSVWYGENIILISLLKKYNINGKETEFEISFFSKDDKYGKSHLDKEVQIVDRKIQKVYESIPSSPYMNSIYDYLKQTKTR